MSTSRNNSQSGYLIILTMIVVFAMSAIALSIMATVSSKYATSARNLITENAVSAAEAGISDTVQQLNSNAGFAGWTDTAHPRLFYDRSSTDQGKATYTTTVSAVAADGTQTITSIGTVKRTDTDPNPNVKTVKAVLKKVQKAFGGSLIAGPGGLSSGTAYHGISVSKGDAVVLGTVFADSSTTINIASPGKLYASNIGCGTADWPKSCAPSEPLSVGCMGVYSCGSISAASVCGTGQVNSDGISGFQANCTSPYGLMPAFDKQAFIAQIKTASPTPITAASIMSQCNQFVGYGGDAKVTVPANSWITGDLSPNTAAFGLGGCSILFAGNAYITGNIDVGLWGGLGVADSAGSSRPTIVMNGRISTTDGGRYNASGNAFRANASGTLASIISFYSSNSTCSQNENVPSLSVATCLTPSEAKDSALNYCALSVGGSGVFTDTNMPGAAFYAYYGCVNGSNALNIAGLGGQSISGANITVSPSDTTPFSALLSSVSFTVIDYQQVY